MTILIVDDSAAMRQLIMRLVGDLAEACTECSDGTDALWAYREYRPDWVLMDIQMKDMDGFAAAKEIRAEFPESRIVFVTGYDDPRLREAARQAGAFAYVHKENLLGLRQLLIQGPIDSSWRGDGSQ